MKIKEKKTMFKPCPGCAAPTKCKAMGKCMKKARK